MQLIRIATKIAILQPNIGVTIGQDPSSASGFCLDMICPYWISLIFSGYRMGLTQIHHLESTWWKLYLKWLLNYTQCIYIWIQNAKSIGTYTSKSIEFIWSANYWIWKLNFHTYHEVCYARSLRETICYKLSLFTTLLLKRNYVREDITVLILLIIEQEQFSKILCLGLLVWIQ
jgi:hypothetical protein